MEGRGEPLPLHGLQNRDPPRRFVDIGSGVRSLEGCLWDHSPASFLSLHLACLRGPSLSTLPLCRYAMS